MTQFDLHMMDIALRMAERGFGQAAPNPSVGAVIADEATGELVARGWTQPGGRPHAETEVIRRAGKNASGRTLYVTLEPCAHQGQTPPCTDAIIAAGLKRVVTGIGDPDPRTAGAGLDRLRAAGIDVLDGVRAAEAHWISLGHILRVTDKRPFVQLKIAIDQAGQVPRGKAGHPTFVTSREARACGHLMRARSDAILVGGRTVRDDDPELTCRLPGLGHRSPARVVLSRGGGLPLGSQLAKSAEDVPVWLFVSGDGAKVQGEQLTESGVRVFTNPGPAPCYAARDILRVLADQGITRLLVEGGPGMWKLFMAFADEVVVFKAGCGPLAKQPLAALEHHGVEKELMLTSVRRIGDDQMFVYRRT